MAKAKKEKAQYTKHLKFGEVLVFALGLFGLQMVIFYLNSYQVEFYGASKMVPAEQMVIVPFIILGARIVSALFDPIIGNLIDRKKTGKLGKLKPFILYSIAPLLIFTIIIFLKLPFKGFGLYAWIFVTTTAWSIAMTVADVPSQAMSAVLTPDPTERTNVIGFSGTLRSIGQAAPYVVVPVICAIVPKGATLSSGSLNMEEYLVSAIVIGILGCLMLSLIVFFNKERVPYVSEKMDAKTMFQTIKGNKYLLLIVASYFLGFARQGAMAIQLQAATAILGSANRIIILGISTAVGTMISMALTPLLIKHLDERKVFVGLSVYGFVSSLIAFLVGKYSSYNLPALIAVLFLIGLQFGAVNIMPMVMVADSVDYYEHKTGKRVEGIAYAVLSFSIKVTLALGAAVCLAVVYSKSVGYDATIDPANITKKTKDGVFFSYTLIPGITSLLAAIPILFYDLTKDKKRKISEELNSRRSARLEGVDAPEAIVQDVYVDSDEVQNVHTDSTEGVQNAHVDKAKGVEDTSAKTTSDSNENLEE